MWWALWLVPLVGSYPLTLTCPEMCFCDSEITSCQYQELTQLPNDIDANVTNLDLSFNEFENFPSGMEFAQLLGLNLSHNKIATLKLTDFRGLKNLQRIDISFNLFHDWKDIYSTTFWKMDNLQYLDLSNNPLRSISKESSHLQINSLQVLRLVNCSMKSIPPSAFSRLPNLKELYLSDNPVSSINETFKLSSLQIMDLSRTHLSFLHENAFAQIPNLEQLILNNNFHLKRFTCHSDSVLYLDLSNGNLEKVPSGRMKRLIRLDLSFSYLKMINPNGFVNFPNLQVLNLSRNALTSIHSDAFEGLNEVITIDLSYNKISQLDEGLFANNSALTFLNLSYNYIKQLDTISSKSLKMLIASNCEIYQLHRDSLALMPYLVTLILSRNFLTKLPNRLVAPNLVILDVSYCRINALNNETFEEMFYLREINLQNNALTTIDPAYFPRAFKAIIGDNPWRCDCPKLKRMFEWMTAYSENTLSNLICNSPEKFEGQTWEQACEEEWYPNKVTKDTMWYYSLGIVIAMVLALFALIILRKVKSLQEQRVHLEEEARRAEERDALRRMQERQREIREEEDRNAPDPRDLQRPPSYNEALLLPRMDASHPSLAGSVHSFGSRGSLRGSTSDIAKKNKIRRKRRRRKSEEERRASRITVDSDSSDQYQSMDNLSSRRKPAQAPPLESDF